MDDLKKRAEAEVERMGTTREQAIARIREVGSIPKGLHVSKCLLAAHFEKVLGIPCRAGFASISWDDGGGRGHVNLPSNCVGLIGEFLKVVLDGTNPEHFLGLEEAQ